MIELIFVIVIIGILAAVAIPKLTATRDDAKISICAHELSLFQREVTAYYTGHKALNTLAVLTNIKTSAGSGSGFTDANTTNMDGNGTTTVAYVCEGATTASFTYNNSDVNETITLNIVKPTSPDGLGKSVAKLMDTKGFFRKYNIGGSSGFTY
jgi:type II secretory pathway pseudopilin PulG